VNSGGASSSSTGSWPLKNIFFKVGFILIP
jgi:hypothetical protein